MDAVIQHGSPSWLTPRPGPPRLTYSLPPSLSFPGPETFLWTLRGPGSASLAWGLPELLGWGFAHGLKVTGGAQKRGLPSACVGEDGAQETEGRGWSRGCGPCVPLAQHLGEDCWRMGAPVPGKAPVLGRHADGGVSLPSCDVGAGPGRPQGPGLRREPPWRARLSWAGKVQAPASGAGCSGYAGLQDGDRSRRAADLGGKVT